MRCSKFAVVVAVVAGLGVGGGAANAEPPSRDMANSLLAEGKTHLDAGEFADAASSFEGVLDLRDSGNELVDLRAVAGVFLCLARAKGDQLDAARSACRNVIEMRDAPQTVKDQAAKLLDKLN